MDIRKLARALLAWAAAHRSRPPHQDRARLERALSSKLSPHLLKDVGASDD
jgi:hypothetical protein